MPKAELYTIRGITRTTKEWCEYFSCSITSARVRLAKGDCTLEECFTQPRKNTKQQQPIEPFIKTAINMPLNEIVSSNVPLDDLRINKGVRIYNKRN